MLTVFLLAVIISILLVSAYTHSMQSFLQKNMKLFGNLSVLDVAAEGYPMPFVILENHSATDITLEDHSTTTVALEYHPSTPNVTLKPHFKTKCFLLVLVMTRVDGKQRNAVRKTWFQEAKKLSPKVLAKFVVGTYGLSNTTVESLYSEHRQYQDMIFFPSLIDKYENLTLKTLLCMQWIEQNVEMEYWLKTDDDSYVLIKKMLSELEVRNSTIGLYWGFMHYYSPVRSPLQKNDKEHNWFLCRTFLPFVSGGGYIISADAIHAVVANADMIQLYANEDTSVAVWLSSFNLERKHDSRFNMLNAKCIKNQVLVHWVPAKQIYSLHQRFLSTGHLDSC